MATADNPKGIVTLIDKSSWGLIMKEEPLSWLLEAETVLAEYSHPSSSSGI
jgi:hypothetical protein